MVFETGKFERTKFDCTLVDYIANTMDQGFIIYASVIKLVSSAFEYKIGKLQTGALSPFMRYNGKCNNAHMSSTSLTLCNQETLNKYFCKQ